MKKIGIALPLFGTSSQFETIRLLFSCNRGRKNILEKVPHSFSVFLLGCVEHIYMNRRCFRVTAPNSRVGQGCLFLRESAEFDGKYSMSAFFLILHPFRDDLPSTENALIFNLPFFTSCHACGFAGIQLREKSICR